jgi:enamine deaminase RidA (YjgF/YER057c/UK114 family)
MTEDASARRPEEVLSSLGLELPAPFPPAASYVAVRIDGNIAYVSGHGPMRDGKVAFPGKVGRDLDVETGRQSAELTMLNVLASLQQELGELSRVTGFLKLLVLVNATEDFDKQHLVADGASDLIHRVFGADSVHARSAIGVASLPFGISTEIEAVVRID